MTDDFLPEILRGFVAESRSYLEALRDLVARPGGESGAPDLVEGHRLLHCVRGAASMLELGEIAWTAGRGEALLEAAAHGQRAFDAPARAELGGTLDAVELALADLEAGLPPAEAEEGASLAFQAGPPPPPPPARDATGAGDLLDGFIEEAEEHLGAVAEALRELTKNASPEAATGALREIRRRVHTLKGTAAMVGFGEVSRLSHALEDALESGTGRDRLDLLHEAVDLLEDLVRHPEDAALPARVEPLAARLRVSGDAPTVADRAEEPAASFPTPASAPPQELVRVPLGRVDTLVRVAGELVVQRSVLERVHRELVRQAGELGLSLKRLSSLSDRLEADYEAAALTGTGRPGATLPASPPADTEFDELELDRYTDFHLLTRGLAETVSDVQTVGSELATTTSDFEGFIQRQQRLLRELQDDLLRLRAVPLSTLAARLHRTVRDTAGRCGRKAVLVFEGESVELDKSLLDSVADPLLHLVRNAVAHGIEPAEARSAAGKPEEGTVRVTARYQGGQAVLEVADDGAGIDLGAVRAAALDLGLPADDLTDDEALSLVFLPGFTTARAVSEVAGRGVGLDAVRAQVEALRGTVTAVSERGRGARFTVRLPLSLAVTRALLVEVAGQPFAIPASSVSRVLRLDGSEVRMGGGQEALVSLDGEDLPVRPLSEILRLQVGEPEPRPLALVLDLGDHRAAVLVDRLVESRDVAVKPFGPLLRRVDGLAGATLMGDGSVVPILDPYTFPRWELGAGRGPVPVEWMARAASAEKAAAEVSGPLEVLIVDDSLSVRRVLSSLASNAGWVPVTAKDGLEALEVLHSRRRPPGVILLDIEMPRMDGYELAATLRGMPAYAAIPIVMLTSRGGAKHREKALGMGASEYLTKPFQPEVLVHVVERLASTPPGENAPDAAGPAPS